MENYWQLLIQLFLFVVCIYFIVIKIFAKKFTEELGKQTAELVTIKQKTMEVETVKQAFNEELEKFKQQIQINIAREVEPLKASLNRENIAFQIFSTEYLKLRFIRLDELHGKLYGLKKFCQSNLFLYNNEEDFYNKKEQFHIHYKAAEDAMYLASIYIDDNIMATIMELLNVSFDSMVSFNIFYTTDPHRNQFVFENQKQDLIQSLVDRNNHSLERLNNNLDKLPQLLRSIVAECKRNPLVA